MVKNSVASHKAGTQKKNRSGPPMPKVVYRLVNPLIDALLRSPLHGLMSKSLMLLTFRGRKSGKRYTIPVGYRKRGSRLFLFTHSDWWKNLRGGTPVSLRLRGREMRGTATPVKDEASIAEIQRAFLEQHGEAMARRMSIVGDEHDQAGETTAQTPQGTVFIEIKLEG